MRKYFDVWKLQLHLKSSNLSDICKAKTCVVCMDEVGRGGWLLLNCVAISNFIVGDYIHSTTLCSIFTETMVKWFCHIFRVSGWIVMTSSSN